MKSPRDARRAYYDYVAALVVVARFEAEGLAGQNDETRARMAASWDAMSEGDRIRGRLIATLLSDDRGAFHR